MLLFVAALLATTAFAQDPAQGWLGYAMGVNPSGQGRLTKVEAYWVVPQNPRQSGAFFSPWFGIESSDNLNLIQPVNPWSGNHWEIYNEYFQWRPTHNENSNSHTVKAGDTVYGRVTFNPSKQSYTVYHSDMNDNWSVSTDIAVQRNGGGYKNYTIVYFVMEKVARCGQYPPNGDVVFTNITVEYDNQQVQPKWTTSYVDNACDCRAHVVSEDSIRISWNSAAKNPDEKLIPKPFSMTGLHDKKQSVPKSQYPPPQFRQRHHHEHRHGEPRHGGRDVRHWGEGHRHSHDDLHRVHHEDAGPPNANDNTKNKKKHHHGNKHGNKKHHHHGQHHVHAGRSEHGH